MEPSEQIDKQVAELDDWRGRVYANLRRIINEADPGLKEEWKWGTAVWSLAGNVCAVGAFKDHLKINVFKGGAPWWINRRCSTVALRPKNRAPLTSTMVTTSKNQH
jgi:hypothetical protein